MDEISILAAYGLTDAQPRMCCGEPAPLPTRAIADCMERDSFVSGQIPTANTITGFYTDTVQQRRRELCSLPAFWKTAD